MKDREINIAETTNIKKPYQNRKMMWSSLVERCRRTKHTDETLAEFMAMPKERQSEIKDVGGFVGGYLKGGVRRKNSIMSRDIVTLDADNGEDNIWYDYADKFKNAAFCYSTHKHTKEAPRLRLVVLLSRSVTPEEYEPIARYIAERCGIEAFDTTTYQPERVMFWPSTPTDQPYFFKEKKGEAMDPDKVLATYADWHDCSCWARSEREDILIREDHGSMGDPTKKDGIVGAFCRAYTISEAIDTFLPNIYRRFGAGRYTNVNCSCSGGLVVYDDKFAHSFNSTDPLTGKSVNAYDLVRIMLFGDQDKGDHFTKVSTLPSTKAMFNMLRDDEKVNVERYLQDKRTGGEDDERLREREQWRGRLKPQRNSPEPMNCQFNIRHILHHDPELKGKIFLNDLTNEAYFRGGLPWRDSEENGNWTSGDNSALREYLGINYNQTNPQWIKDAFKVLLMEHSVHPVRQYLDKLEWDGTERLDTLLIDYFGCEDTELVRMQTRIEFTAAVARIYDPGTKYDNMIILAGEEGCGKSTFLQKMAMRKEWFNDCVLGGLSGKEAIEGIRGRWIIEISELAALKRNEVETVKNFLSRDEDKYRPAYAEQVERYPRQCVFFGTTNVVDCLRGTDGNRRMWIIRVKDNEPTKDVFTELDDERDQIWAEAKFRYLSGQQLFLGKRLEQMAREKQMAYNELSADPRIGYIKEYLDKLLPDNWDELNILERKAYISMYPKSMKTAIPPFRHRKRVCIMEIQQECLEDRLQNVDEFRPKDVAKLLKWLSDWTYKGETHYKFSLYGPQRYYFWLGDGEKEEKEGDWVPENRNENFFGFDDMPF